MGCARMSSTSSRAVTVIGGGPAGSAAAIAAMRAGARVRLIERSHFPRHKVCGEYLSPEIATVLESLGVWERLLACEPAPIRRFALHFRESEKNCRLPEAALGLSRYCFDNILFDQAARLGAAVSGEAPVDGGLPVILAHGRRSDARRGNRLFGFKAHFSGPVNDAVELFFFSGCYVGVNPVEN